MTEGLYIVHVRQSRRVSKKLGTWVLYAIVEADNLEHFIGYIAYRIADFTRRRQRYATTSPRRVYLNKRIGNWSRTAQWVRTLDPDTAQDLAKRLILDLDTEREAYDYVSEFECSDPRKDKDQPHRRKMEWRPGLGRRAMPWTKPPAKLPLCSHCEGMGTVAKKKMLRKKRRAHEE